MHPEHDHPQRNQEDFVESLASGFRSDELRGLRYLVAWAQRSLPYFRLPPRLYLVPDTNCILKEIDYACRRRLKPGRSALEEVVDAGLVRLFAPWELGDEVSERIADIAEYGGTDPALCIAEWARFREKIHFFRAQDPDPVVIEDPDDAVFVRAARIVGADAVLSDDWHLRRATTTIRPPKVHHELRAVSRAEAVRLGLSTQATLAMALSGVALKELTSLIIRYPKIGVPLLLAAGVGAFLYDRHAVRQTGTSGLRKALGAAGRTLASMLTAIEERTALTQRNLTGALGEGGKKAGRSLGQAVLATLIAAGNPIDEPDLISEVHIEGHDPWLGWPQAQGEDLGAWRTRAWQELGQAVSRFLRTDPRCVWTGGGWTTHLLLATRSAQATAVRDPATGVVKPLLLQPASEAGEISLVASASAASSGLCPRRPPLRPPRLRKPKAARQAGRGKVSAKARKVKPGSKRTKHRAKS